MSDATGHHLQLQYPILKHFRYGHLPQHLQEISRQFHIIAVNICCACDYSDETNEALRKLLEAKDCAVRARLETGNDEGDTK